MTRDGDPPAAAVTGGARGDGYEISELSTSAFPGVIGLADCPGVREERFRPDLLTRDLDEVERWGATAALCLFGPDDAEVVPLGRVSYEMRSRGIGCIHLASGEQGLSDPGFQREWKRVCGRLAHALRRGDRLLMPCAVRRGRKAPAFAWLMIEAGATPDEAIAVLRAVRPGSLATEEEEATVRAYVRQS